MRRSLGETPSNVNTSVNGTNSTNTTANVTEILPYEVYYENHLRMVELWNKNNIEDVGSVLPKDIGIFLLILFICILILWTATYLYGNHHTKIM